MSQIHFSPILGTLKVKIKCICNIRQNYDILLNSIVHVFVYLSLIFGKIYNHIHLLFR